jgi:hypothetical protein
MSDRKKAIETLKQLRLDYEEFYEEHNNEVTQAYDMAIASLETDEAYQLEYEKTTKPTIEEFIEYAQKEFGVIIKAEKSDNPDTYEKLFGTTKKDLGVDCISRKALLNATVKKNSIWNHITNSDGDNLEAIVSKLPSVTPIRPKGHWISHGKHCENLGVIPSGLGAYEWCSNCDCGIDVREWHRNHYNYCPNCGSDNREVEE